MTDWLRATRIALNARKDRVRMFFRDDDAGWDSNRLWALLDLFERVGMPIDLAVIPEALDQNLADELLRRRLRNIRQLGLHQHGYRHTNYETEGRKCEFGGARSYAEQYADILAGRERIIRLLGNEHVDRIFTPPWNRCTQATASCLIEIGFHCFSRDVNAVPLARGELVEMPIHIDWCKANGTQVEARNLRDKWIAETIGKFDTVGIMFHHAVMDDEDLFDVQELLQLFKQHGVLDCQTMSSLIEQRDLAVSN